MHEKYQNHSLANRHFVSFFIASVLIFLSFFVTFLSFTKVEAAKSEEDGGSTSVEELKPGEVKLTNDDAKKAHLNPTTAKEAITGTLNGVYTVIAIVAVIVIIAAGISIMVADGDSQKVATARKAIIYACAGLVIVGSAFIITGIVQGIGT